MEPISSPLTQNSHPYIDHYKIIKRLGYGVHSFVFLAENNNQQFAIKKYNPDTADLSILYKQAQILQLFNHQNIINLKSILENTTYKTKDGKTQSCFALVLEYAETNSLFNFIYYSGRLAPNIARTYFVMLLDAIQHIHSKGVAHRDIKLQNILLDREFNLKLTDFGHSSFITQQPMHEETGTQMYYKAPQIRNHNYRGEEVDLFSAGVCLFIMVTGNPPFEFSKQKDLTYKYPVFWSIHQNKSKKELFTQNFKDLIQKMLNPKPEQRLKMHDIRNHPWVKEDCFMLHDLRSIFEIKQSKVINNMQKARQMQKQKNMRNEKLFELQCSFSSSNDIRCSDMDGELLKIFEEVQSSQIILEQSQFEHEQDLVLSIDLHMFVFMLHVLLLKKKRNLVVEDEEFQSFDVCVDSKKNEVLIGMEYTPCGWVQNEKLRVIIQLFKDPKGLLKVVILRDERQDSIRSMKLVDLIRKQFEDYECK